MVVKEVDLAAFAGEKTQRRGVGGVLALERGDPSCGSGMPSNSCNARSVDASSPGPSRGSPLCSSKNVVPIPRRQSASATEAARFPPRGFFSGFSGMNRDMSSRPVFFCIGAQRSPT